MSVFSHIYYHTEYKTTNSSLLYKAYRYSILDLLYPIYPMLFISSQAVCIMINGDYESTHFLNQLIFILYNVEYPLQRSFLPLFHCSDREAGLKSLMC